MDYGNCKLCRGKMYKTTNGLWSHVFSHNNNDHKGVVVPDEHYEE